ncbi:MAG: hypothetical protein ACYC4S_11755 [Rhodoferax sp.]
MIRTIAPTHRSAGNHLASPRQQFTRRLVDMENHPDTRQRVSRGAALRTTGTRDNGLSSG